MARKYYLLLAFAISASMIYSCGSNTEKAPSNPPPGQYVQEPGDSLANKPGEVPSDNTTSKGIGKFKDVKLNHPLDQKLVDAGKATYDVKCGSCHKLTEEKLVGPGWKGVTDRRTPEWILNFVTNTDEMIDKDATAQKMMEICMVKMPNQNLNDQQAMEILEFMRKNDGKN
ncbi:c-type cytochrome [Taibaiella soli]|nr:cytochrome c [Taibaiella soli]